MDSTPLRPKGPGPLASIQSGRSGSAGGRATPVVADTTVTSDVVRLFDAVEKEEDAPEIVVYNAGNNRFKALLEMDDAFFEDVWRLCCLGGFIAGREAARRMVPAPTRNPVNEPGPIETA